MRKPFRLFTALAALSLVAAACSSGGGGTTDDQPKTGGSIVVGAEQWAECMNPVNGCASAYWQTLQTWLVLPRLVSYDNAGNSTAGDVLVELPTLENGGVTEDPFTVTFKIKPEAVWDDGTPITSADVDFTWRAIMNTVGSYDQTGYDLITEVDASDPATAIVKFKSPFADWIDLFGGDHFGLLKKAAFPDVDQEKPNLAKEMASGPLSFSGGPWKQTKFTKTEAEFVRNDAYWGQKPYLDSMTWVYQTDQNTEIQAMISGETDVAFPQPTNVSVLTQIGSNPDLQAVAGTGVFYEGLWPNLEHPFLKDRAVRQALAYAVDREEILKGLIHLNAPQEEVLNCGPFALPGRGIWCSTTPWEVYTYQPDKSIELLEGAGWDCSGVPDKPCSKDGEDLVLEYRYCNGNARRETTFELIKEKVKPAGFAWSHGAAGNDCSEPLFTKTLPKGNFAVADYANGPLAVDPSPTSNFSCEGIPTEANGYGGGNFVRWCDEEWDAKMKASDAELDPAKRLPLLEELWQHMADEALFLPLYVLPNITIWNAAKLGGPVGEANANPYATFANAHLWYLK